MKWHEFSSAALKVCDKDLPVIIPLGSCEQHGHHLPLFVDSLQVGALAERIENRLGEQALFLPVQWLGASHHHMDFCGTISLRPKLYAEVIQAITLCILHHGFHRLFFLNGHGGNITPAAHALTDLIAVDDRADAAEIGLASWWTLASESMQPKEANMVSPHLTHACEYETSLILALRPDLVDLSKIPTDATEKQRPWANDPRWGGHYEGFHRFHRWTSSGHMGKPQAASAEKGEQLLANITDTLVDFIKDFSKLPKMSIMPEKSQIFSDNSAS